MNTLLVPGLILKINENAVLYKVPKSAIDNQELSECSIRLGDYIFILENVNAKVSEKIKIGDLRPEDKHRILINFIKKILKKQFASLREKYHIDGDAIYFSEGRKWLIDKEDRVYLQEIKGFEIEAHLINDNSIAILVYAKRTYRFVKENGDLASIEDMKSLFKTLKKRLKEIKVLLIEDKEKTRDILKRLYFEPNERIIKRAGYHGPIVKLKNKGYKPMNWVYPILDDKFRSVLREWLTKTKKESKILDEIIRRYPDDYIEVTEKLREFLLNHKCFRKIFMDEPKIITRDIIESTDGIWLGQVSDYELLFRKGSKVVKSVRDVIDAIRHLGPYDDIHKKLGKETIKVAIQHDLKPIYKKILAGIIKNLERALKRLGVKACFLQPQEISLTETTKCDILIHIHEHETKDYWRIKELYLREGIPPQAILLENYWRMKDKGAYFNNIAIGIFAKLGGRPWVIGKPISNFLGKNAYYVGFDVSRMAYEGQHASAACIVAYDGEGTYVKHKPVDIAVSKEHLDEDNAERLMIMIIKDYLDIIKKERLNGKRNELFIVFMRDGLFSNDEVNGFRIALKRINDELKKKGQSFTIKLYLLEFRKGGGVPLLEREDSDKVKYRLADEGTYVVFRTLESPRNKFALYVQTLGKDCGLRLVRAVKVAPRYYGYENNEEFGWPVDKVDDLALVIYRLSRLNWSSFRGRSKLPVPVHYADRMAYFMEKGVRSKTIEETKLYFL